MSYAEIESYRPAAVRESAKPVRFGNREMLLRTLWANHAVDGSARA